LGLTNIELPINTKIEPNQTTTINIHLQAQRPGEFPVKLQMFRGNQPFDSAPFEMTVAVKSPAILIPHVQLLWKNDPVGEYILSVMSEIITNSTQVSINSQGEASPVEAKYLLPDYSFQFTLYKQFYQPKTITQKIQSGNNILDFGTLNPDFLSALFKPNELWKLLPFNQ
jgi:hypothetical protein